MKITSLVIENIRAFKKEELRLSPTINILVGPNNAGKSTILHALLSLQSSTSSIKPTDVRLREMTGEIRFKFKNGITPFAQHAFDHIRLRINNGNQHLYGIANGGHDNQLNLLPANERKNLIYPFLSKRKAVRYQETINSEYSLGVTGNFEHLYAKIDKVSNPSFQPAYDDYVRISKEVLGFIVSTMHSENGKKAAFVVRNAEHIPLDVMGEGVANVVGLLVDLCVAENKIFVIEELENDIHPEALKRLLRFVVEKSQTNQLFISTHSNVVLKYLGAHPSSKVFHVRSLDRENNIPTSEIVEVPNDSENRRRILESLGYDIQDADLWSAWLFLEESSAEKIIREFLIPWFVPELANRVRTFSAGGVDAIEAKLADFLRLFVFLHLQPVYRNRVWIAVDAGESGAAIVGRLKTEYLPSGWQESQFRLFAEKDFERYYPARFASEAEAALINPDKQSKRKAKCQLREKVEGWVRDNEPEARAEFQESAKEIIDFLKEIGRRLTSTEQKTGN